MLVTQRRVVAKECERRAQREGVSEVTLGLSFTHALRDLRQLTDERVQTLVR